VVPLGVFMLELHEASITNTLAKDNKVAESSQETTPLAEGMSESPKVVEVHSDWCTSFMIYLRIGGL
jgi:hypothetical protein